MSMPTQTFGQRIRHDGKWYLVAHLNRGWTLMDTENPDAPPIVVRKTKQAMRRWMEKHLCGFCAYDDRGICIYQDPQPPTPSLI